MGKAKGTCSRSSTSRTYVINPGLKDMQMNLKLAQS